MQSHSFFIKRKLYKCYIESESLLNYYNVKKCRTFLADLYPSSQEPHNFQIVDEEIYPHDAAYLFMLPDIQSIVYDEPNSTIISHVNSPRY